MPTSISCDPNTLAQSSKCMACLSPATHMEVQTYLLALIAGGSTDPNTLAQQAKAFQALNPSTLQEIQAMLLCAIVNK